MTNRDAEPQYAADTTKPLSKTVLRGGKWLGLAALAQALLQIVVVAVLARLLSPAEFGLVAVAGIVIDLAAGIATMGASKAIVQRAELTRHHIRAGFWISVAMGTLMTVGLHFAAGPVASALRNPSAAPMISVLALTFLIRGLGAVPEGLATRRFDFRLLAVRKLISYVLGYGAVGITAAYLGAGSWSLVYAQLAQVSLETLLLIAAVRFDCRFTTTWSAYREVFSYGSGFSVANVLNSVANQIDRTIIATNVNTAAVGLYTRAIQITRYPHRLIGKAIEDVLFPTFSGVQDDRARLTAAYYRSVGAICIIMTPVSTFFCITAAPITDLLLGPQWSEAIPLITIFGVTILFRSVQRSSVALLLALGNSWLIAALEALLIVSTAIGTLIGVKFGLIGASIGVTAAFMLHYLAIAAATAIKMSLSARRLIAQHFVGIVLTVPVAVGAAVGSFAAHAELLPSPVALLVSGVLAVTLAVAAITASPRIFLRDDGRWLLSMLLARVPGKLRKKKLAAFLIRRIAL